MITKFTMTGADNSISISDLNDMAYRFPFSEWGILVSGKQYGNKRFPSKIWIEQLRNEGWEGLNLSCHLCGQFVRDILMGHDAPIRDLGILWDMFARVQINTHGIPHSFDAMKMVELLKAQTGKEFIFQYDNCNAEILEAAINGGVKCSTLFDLSHGAGVLPTEWPRPLNNISCGYAGGLSPDNLDSQIQLIESKVGETKIWIDMETHVRSNNDVLFDLSKVEQCFNIAAKYITA